MIRLFDLFCVIPAAPPPHTSSPPPPHLHQENGAIHFLYQVKYIHNFYSFNIFLSFRLLYTSQCPSDRATYYYLGYEEDEKNIPRAKEDKITLVHQEKIYNRTGAVSENSGVPEFIMT